LTLPAFLFGALLCSFYGFLFHLIVGGKLGRLILFVILAWMGFWAGHFLADSQGWTFASAGPLRLGLATLFSLLFLGAGYFLSLVRVEEKRD
jgi:hypothetical protein